MESQTKDFRQKRLEQAKAHAISKGGQCLSNAYNGAKGSLLWKCHDANHKEWKARFDHVVQGNRWCPDCGRENTRQKNKLTDGLERAKAHAQKLGGECLSTEFKGTRPKLLWKCGNPEHDAWSARFDHVVRGGWCPQCGLLKHGRTYREYINIDKAKDHARSKGGACLSDIYKNHKEPLNWKCSDTKHNSWFDSYKHVVKQGAWCPYCKNDEHEAYKRQKLEEAKRYAKSKGGDCLSTEFVNVKSKLIWKCENPNHPAWKASIGNVMEHSHSNSWCPECGKEEASMKWRANLKSRLQHLDTAKLTLPQIRKILDYQFSDSGLRTALNNEKITYFRRSKNKKQAIK